MSEFERRERKEYIWYFRKKPFIVMLVLVLSAVLYFGLPPLFKTNYQSSFPAVAVSTIAVVEAVPAVVHLPTPKSQKAIYMTSCVVGTASFRNELVKLVDETELNSIVIDVKDYSGYLSFTPKNEKLKVLVSKQCMAQDMKEFIEKLHEKDIYVIGRITVFQDSVLTKLRPELAVKKKSDGGTWHDYQGLSFTDPGSKEVWDHHVAIAKEAYAIGFDELNFDYIRFPSDGKLENASYDFWDGATPKAEIIKSFFIYLDANLKDLAAPISADLFGLTTWRNDDMNIGQILENAIPYFDYISPMVYPSHYPPGFDGYKNPASHPYEIILTSLNKAVERLNSASSSPLKIRPWLQDFDLGANYTAEMIKKEKQAVYDAGLNSWLIWDPKNKYTREAYE